MMLLFLLINLTIDDLVKNYSIPLNKISIVIYSLDEEKMLFAHNENKPLIPASNMKLIISAYLIENWQKIFLKGYQKNKVLAEINSKSNNRLANRLFYFIGQSQKKSSEKVLLAFLKEKGIPVGGIRIFDGAGFSKKNRLTTLAITKLLIYLYNSPYQQEFLRSLAVAGKRGTLKRRLINYKKKIYAKTGYLKNVRSLSGYYFENNKKYCFSIIINWPLKKGNYWQFLNQLFSCL
jgi:D-alanyl-D-alanine carboxypeptidase/D-alanyl-D-alanine-endopeptidase (penicillin-binding protein 4)